MTKVNKVMIVDNNYKQVLLSWLTGNIFGSWNSLLGVFVTASNVQKDDRVAGQTILHFFEIHDDICTAPGSGGNRCDSWCSR